MYAMKEVDDYRWISLEDRGSERAMFWCETDPVMDRNEQFGGLAVAHTEWQRLSDINDRFAGGNGTQSLPVIQID